MKKVIFICLMLAVAGCAWAQRPVGDTLIMPDTDYFNNNSYLACWPINVENLDSGWHSTKVDINMMHVRLGSQHGGGVNSRIREGNYIGGMQMYTERPIKIIGIAICAYMQRPMDTTVSFLMDSYDMLSVHEFHPEMFFPNTRDTTMRGRITDSAILYKPTANGLVELRSAPWRIEQPHRFLHLPPQDSVLGENNIPHNPLMPWTYEFLMDPILPIYEVMFKDPVIV